MVALFPVWKDLSLVSNTSMVKIVWVDHMEIEIDRQSRHREIEHHEEILAAMRSPPPLPDEIRLVDLID